jgi:hypothetical protein
LSPISGEASSSPKGDELDELSEANLLPLSIEPFSSVPSVRQIAHRICVPKRCVNCISLACRFSAFHTQISDIRHLHWVPHKLSDNQKSNRVVDPTSRPPVVDPASRIKWGHILHIFALNESWFYLSTDQIMRWSGCQMKMRDDVSDREKHMIQSPKLMLPLV